jgi:hypothetical protein
VVKWGIRVAGANQPSAGCVVFIERAVAESIRRLAGHDTLTGTPNRRGSSSAHADGKVDFSGVWNAGRDVPADATAVARRPRRQPREPLQHLRRVRPARGAGAAAAGARRWCRAGAPAGGASTGRWRAAAAAVRRTRRGTGGAGGGAAWQGIQPCAPNPDGNL